MIKGIFLNQAVLGSLGGGHCQNTGCQGDSAQPVARRPGPHLLEGHPCHPRFLSRPFIIRVTFFLIFSFHKETPN